MVYIAALKFWPGISYYWQTLRDSKTAFSQDCYAVDVFMKKSKDANLRRDIMSKVK